MPALTAVNLLNEANPAEKLGDYLVYLVSGSDEYLAGQAVTAVRDARLDRDFSEFNYTRLECSAAMGAAPIVDALNELPMLTQYRVLELNNAHLLKPEVGKEVATALEKAVGFGQIVVTVVWKVTGKGKGAAALKDAANRLGMTIDCSVNEETRALWVEQQLNRLGLKSSPSVVRAITSRTGNDLQNLATQLAKLAAYLGPGQTPTVNDITKLVNKSSETRAWELTAAIAKRDVKGAITVGNELLSEDKEGGVSGLLSYTNSYVRSIAQLRSLRDQFGDSPSVLAKYLPNKKPYAIRKSLEELDTWAESDLRRAFEALMRADLRIKIGGDPLLVMQLLILQLCRRRGVATARRS